jgi:hypothetical protein
LAPLIQAIGALPPKTITRIDLRIAEAQRELAKQGAVSLVEAIERFERLSAQRKIALDIKWQ